MVGRCYLLEDRGFSPGVNRTLKVGGGSWPYSESPTWCRQGHGESGFRSSLPPPAGSRSGSGQLDREPWTEVSIHSPLPTRQGFPRPSCLTLGSLQTRPHLPGVLGARSGIGEESVAT